MALKSPKAGFLALGYGEESSTILASMVGMEPVSIEDIAGRCDLSQKTVSGRIRQFIRKDVVVETHEGRFRLSARFVAEASSRIRSFAKRFEDRLVESMFLDRLEIIGGIKRAFKENGYSVVERRGPGPESRVWVDLPIDPIPSFFAESMFRFGIRILTSDECTAISRLGSVPVEMILEGFSDMNRAYHCLGIFLFFESSETDRRAYSKFASRLRKMRRMNRDGMVAYMCEPGSDVRDYVSSSIVDIEAKTEIARSHLKDIETILARERESIVRSTMLITQLRSLVSGEFMPFRRKVPRRESAILEPVKSVVDRESRNLEIFERKFNEDRNRFQNIVDGFDKRVEIPSLAVLDHYRREFEILNAKFEPIRHELQYLYDLILVPYVRGEGIESANPFLLTEPNSLESFTVDQDSAKREISRFLSDLKESGQGLLFLVGKAGSGKTHLQRQELYPRAKAKKIWPVYIDCPMRYDLIAGLFSEIVRPANFPEGLSDYVSAISESKVSTAEDFVAVIRRLHSLLESTQYEGLLLIMDELENSLPYTYSSDFQLRGMEREPPLALSQLSKVLSSQLGSETGFVISLRTTILPEVKRFLHLEDFDRFRLVPERLDSNQFGKLITERYKVWKCRRIRFSDAAIRRVIALTDGNARHTIQYFRALYDRAAKKGQSLITIRTVNSQPRIPLFSY